jgi:hypothetical protein
LLHNKHGRSTILIESAAVNAGTDATTKRQDSLHVRSVVRGVFGAAAAWWYIRQQQPFNKSLQQCDPVVAAKVQQCMYWSSESWFNVSNSVRSQLETCKSLQYTSQQLTRP